MKIARIKINNNEHYGIVTENQFQPIKVTRNDLGFENFLVSETANFVSNGSPINLAEADFSWLPPIARPGKVICIGRNYLAHAEETGNKKEEVPLLFSKYPNCMVGHNSSVPYPSHTEYFDYEVELAVIMGKTASKLAESDDPLKYIFGYTVGNDLTARDVQRSEKQWTRGKAFDNSLPIGPTITTSDEMSNPSDKDIWLTVNGENRQLSNTSRLMFDIPYLIRYISQNITLYPGDIIMTGTPSGVGMYMDPPGTLKKGDQVACGVTDVGELRFNII